MVNYKLKQQPDDAFPDLALELEQDPRPGERLLARLITGQTVAVAFLTLMTALGALLSPNSGLLSLLPLGATAAIVGVISYWLLRQHRFRLAGYTFLLGTCIAITANVFMRGYHDASAIYYLWPILGAVMVLEARGGVLVAVISTVAYLILVGAQRLGYQTPPYPYDPQEEALLTVGSRVMMFFLLAFLAWLTSQNLARALQQVRQAAMGLRELNATLERRIVERTEQLARRTAEMEESNRQNQRRAAQLEVSSKVVRAIGSILDPDQLLDSVVNLISDYFGHYHTAIFLLEESGRWAALRATNSKGGQRMLARGHRLAVGTQGIVGMVTSTGQPYVAHNVGADAVHFDNPDLPNTRTEIALPLIARNQIVGALDIQSTEEAAFDANDVAVFRTLADQIAIALDNARIYATSQVALDRVQALQRQYTGELWDKLNTEIQTEFFEYGQSPAARAAEELSSAVDDTLSQGITTAAQGQDGHTANLVAPIKVRGQIIGALGLQGTKEDTSRVWSPEEIAMIETIADQVGQAMEATRLLIDAQRSARREQLVADVASRIRSAPDIDSILRVSVQEIRRALGVSHGAIRLGTETHLRPPDDLPSNSPGISKRDSQGGHSDE